MTKYEQVAEILDKQGYILDQQSFKIFGENWTGSSEYVRKWKRLQADKNFFKDKEIIEKKKGNRCYMIRTTDGEVNCYYKVGKEFYVTLNNLKAS